MDAIAQFKDSQKAVWSTFSPLETLTATAAPRLVSFAGITREHRVLDVACGTGVVALTAARTTGARVTGVDLTPELVARAKENAKIAAVDAEWHCGDVEALPFGDATFDVVVSQFGHMFAPRPDVAVREMLRVLKPGGTIAFATWPPELFTGRMVAVTARYGPPPPPGVSPPPQWGVPDVVRERLGDKVKDLVFHRDVMRLPALSPQHVRAFMEHNGPFVKLFAKLADDPPRLELLRREFEALTAEYFENNTLRQDYLLSRATKS